MSGSRSVLSQPPPPPFYGCSPGARRPCVSQTLVFFLRLLCKRTFDDKWHKFFMGLCHSCHTTNQQLASSHPSFIHQTLDSTGTASFRQLSSATTHRSISPQNTRHYCLCQGELLPNMSQISTHNHCIIWLTDGMTTKTDHITSFMHLITKAETTNTVISQSQLENNFTVKLYQ